MEEIIKDSTGQYKFKYLRTEEENVKVYDVMGLCDDYYIYSNEVEFDENGRVILTEEMLEDLDDLSEYLFDEENHLDSTESFVISPKGTNSFRVYAVGSFAYICDVKGDFEQDEYNRYILTKEALDTIGRTIMSGTEKEIMMKTIKLDNGNEVVLHFTK